MKPSGNEPKAPAARQRSADDICRSFKAGPGACRWLGQAAEPDVFLDLLIEKRQYGDAVRFLAHWLAEREAVWWACLCTWHMRRGQLTPAEHAALGAAVHWVFHPSKEGQGNAAAAAKQLGKGKNGVASAARAAAQAIYEAPTVLPKRPTAARIVAASVFFAIARAEPGEQARISRQFLALGRDVAAGKMLWADHD